MVGAVGAEPSILVTKSKQVADASIMPNCIRSNTNCTTVMIGEWVAEWTKQWYSSVAWGTGIGRTRLTIELTDLATTRG